MENGKLKIENKANLPKYKILIENLEFEAVIGILEFERKKAQKITVNCEIEYEKKENFIDYAEVCNLIEKTIKEEKFKLLEDAVDKIEKKLLHKYPQMKSLKLKIQKPEILKNALVGVEILRKY
jgi:dihydroneopterin aldolase